MKGLLSPALVWFSGVAWRLLTKKTYLHTTLLVLAWLATAPLCLAANVLVLHSYHPGYRWTDDIQAGIASVFQQQPGKHSLDIQYLDTKRHADDGYFDRLRALLSYKYQQQRFDLILTSDDLAFNFVLKHRDQLFPGVPVVFCGVNAFKPERIEGQQGITGINEQADILGGLQLALRLHPDTREVLLITDTTETGQIIRTEIEAFLPELPDDVQFRLLDDIKYNDLLKHVDNLNEHSLVYLTLFFRDADGRFFEYDELAEQVLQRTSVPVYATWDFNLGQGVVGGLLTSGFYQGQAAAEYGLRVLGGEPAERIAPLMHSPNRFMFDYPVLQRLHLNPAQLPKDSIIINRPVSFYDSYRSQVWFATLVAFSLLLLLLIQGRHIARQRATKHELKKSKQTLQGIFDHSYHFVALLDRDGALLKANRTATDFFGIVESQVLGDALWNTPLWNPSEESIQRLRNAVERAANGGEDRFDLTLIDAEGVAVAMDFSVRPLTDDQGRMLMLIIEGRDISNLKEAGHALSRQNERLEQQLHQRSQDLENSNRELKQTLERLKCTREQLLDSEKMAKLGALVAGVSHEISTPLGVSITAASHLEDLLIKLLNHDQHNPLNGAELEGTRAELQESCEILKNNLQRSAALIKSFKMIAVDQSCDERRTYNCKAYIDDTLLALKAELKNYPHTITVECPADLEVNGYPGLFSQLLTNLLINSVSHAFDKGQAGQIYIRVTALGDQLELCYGDDGIGVSKQQLARLFEPFYTTRRDEGNSGLGTFIIHNISTQLLKGTLECRSEPGQGLHYRITLPLKAPQVVDLAMQAHLPRPGH